MHDGRARIDAEKLLSEARWASRLARSLVRDDAAAQDVVQSAFVAALESAPNVDGRLRPWLARVVRNFAAQTRRGEAHRTDRERASARAERSPSAAETAERIESQRVLVEALEALEEPYRTTVTLRYLEGLSAAQIARRERIPAGTVRWRLKEGLDRLRARLDRRFGGERKSWALALVPLVRRPPLGVAAVLEGVLVMNMALKLGIAAALVVAASVGVYLTVDRGATTTAPLAGQAPAETSPDLVGTDIVGARSALAETTTSAVREEVAGGASRTSGPAPVEETSARLRARCVDPSGAPLSGARFELFRRSDVAAASASDGRVSLAIELGGPSEEVLIIASHPGRATRFEKIVLDRGKTTELGDFVLEPGGTVAGLVVGQDGTPVAGATVLATKPEFADRLEALRRQGPDRWLSGKLVPAATTDANGKFLVEGVPARSVRVWAGAEDTLYTCSDPIEIAAGEMRSDLRLVLEPLAPDDVLEGVVLDPDGSPVAEANVIAYWNGGFSSGGEGTSTDEAGRFRIRVREKTPHDLRVHDPKARWPESILPGVRPGARDLELRFSEPGEFELHVQSRGRAVSSFATRLLSADGEHLLANADESVHEDGRVRLRVPPARFFVEVLARGHARGRLGPYEPSGVPASVECSVEALPGVRGRVSADGHAIEGASLELHPFPPPGTQVISDGFPTRLDPRVVDTVRSDAEGRFELTVREPGSYALVSEAEGLATTELSPIEIVPETGVDGLEVAMAHGGAIEGRVLVPSGRDPAGTIVGISRGDGYPQTARTNADGTFRFERLAPGRWNVTRAAREVRTRGESSMWSLATDASEAPWNCTVAEGRTTRFDLDLRNEQACAVAAKVAFGDRPVEGWTLSIETSEHSETTGAGLDEHGRARVEISRPGTYTLALRTAGAGFDARFNHRTELARGETGWNLDVTVGGIEGRVRAGTNERLVHLLYQAQLPGGVQFDAWVTADRDGRFRLPFAPAGKGSIFRIADEDTSERRIASTREVEVKPGETLTVDVD